ncbi:MAG: NADP-dependent oxidoreductase [Candidatus Poribacteria bacterium]|nr:NADP-dependent oxidoreductase [Candidatus Poribacteria bacterium]
MANINRQITLAARPVSYPKLSDFKLVSAPIPTPDAGQVLVRTIYLSVDPYMRGRMNARASYAAYVEIGEVMIGSIVGEVNSSNHSDFQEGDIVEGSLGWQEYALSDGDNLRKVDPTLAPISTAIGVLGMPGMTAYFGLLEITQPQPGETVVVSGAAGAVGSLVGQIAKIKGCRVVGIAGSDRKIDYVTNELGFDAAFNYKTTEDYGEKLQELCPDGLDVYFDNVGGAITDAVFPLMNVKARVSICGQISQYNLENPELGPRFLWHLITKRAKIEGFLVFEFADKHDEGRRQMAEWIKAGKLKYREDIVEGFENAPAAFIGMLKGDNIGKRLIKVSDQ